jgi:predicted RNA-binding Zn ribbon-like protein
MTSVHSHPDPPDYQFDLSGGAPCLDFANTVSWRKAPQQLNDHLRNYGDLVAFAEQSTMLSAQQAGRLRAQARSRGSAAQRTWQKAIAYRETLYHTFTALAGGKLPAPNDLQKVNDFAVDALGHRRLGRADGRYRWEWQWNEDPLGSILWPVAQSAADLLIAPELTEVRMCEAPDCAWLFLDHSRNRSRRWCDMKVCGNRQKARRHYRRAHG